MNKTPLTEIDSDQNTPAWDKSWNKSWDEIWEEEPPDPEDNQIHKQLMAAKQKLSAIWDDVDQGGKVCPYCFAVIYIQLLEQAMAKPTFDMRFFQRHVQAAGLYFYPTGQLTARSNAKPA